MTHQYPYSDTAKLLETAGTGITECRFAGCSLVGGCGTLLSDVTSKRNLATLTPCHSHSYEPSVVKLLEVDEVTSSTNFYILDFLYSWPEVRSILWPAHVKSMGKISTTSFSHQNISIHWEWCWLRSSVMTQATVFIGDPPKVIWGHLRSPTVFCE